MITLLVCLLTNLALVRLVLLLVGSRPIPPSSVVHLRSPEPGSGSARPPPVRFDADNGERDLPVRVLHSQPGARGSRWPRGDGEELEREEDGWD